MSAFKTFAKKAWKFSKSAKAKKITLSLPGLAGMALLSLGASFIYLPAGLIVGGILLLMVDHNL